MTAVAPVIVSVAVAVPLYGAVLVRLVHVLPPFVFTCHWYVGAGFPEATTVNTALPLAVTV